MLIIEDEDRLQPLTGSENHKCELCAFRRATWRGPKKDDATGTPVPMCAWCLLYAGSAWGHERRDKILMMGPTIRQSAIASSNPKVHIPELDERHRLPSDDAEKLMLGVFYTSVKLVQRLGAMLRPLAKVLREV